MKYTVKHRGLTVKEFDNKGDLDAYLADRVQEWVDLGFGYEAMLGNDYLELRTDRGNTVVLSFSPVKEGLTYSELGAH